ncbi:MAG: hypothetical protein HYR62_05305 [Actinobacteria bacterium]|nr:hypothetical protein [Actinomycetota bacterium]MBI3688459.1 hypothetical protein [Actinomycetota bacterium]
MTDPADPFGTAGIRERVLATWAASPARFREDANAEEDLALGAYRDRLVVELAQNASDAAERAGVPGTLRLSIAESDGGPGRFALVAANTGAPLDATGVLALATLRASAKRDGSSVGRFGIGFAAVLAVSEEPEVVSAGGGVRFSRAGTALVVAAVPALAEEVARRDGRVPVLRMPWPTGSPPPAGFDTAVRLPLSAETLPVVRAALEQVTPELLLALPGLARIEVGHRVLTRLDVGRDVLLREDTGPAPLVVRWRRVTRSGQIPPALLRDRPVEERSRSRWTVTWAVPVAADGTPRPLAGRQVVHAPTPSDEPLSLPARLIASFPLDPARRHVAAGPLADFLIEQAAAGYVELLAELRPTPTVLALVPRPGLVMAVLDATLCQVVVRALRERPWLPGGRPPHGLVPTSATVLDAAGAELVTAVDDVLPGLLPADWSGRALAGPLGVLGVRRLSTADLIGAVSGVHRTPSWWRRLYQALDRQPELAADRDALAGLPVPLADGQLVTGPRGLLLPAEGLPVDGLDVLGLRLVHPDAAHPLLERLSAAPATPRGVLADGRVRAAVEASFEDSDPEPVAAAVLSLVAAAGLGPDEVPWLAELALPTSGGEWAPAGELLLPGSPLAVVVDPDSPLGELDPGWVERYGPAALRAVGVLDSFAVLRAADVDLADGDHELDAEPEYYDAIMDRAPDQEVPPRLEELVAVRDLELVRSSAWPDALAMLAREPLRDAVERPATVLLSGGGSVLVPSYTRWWLSHHPVLGGRRPCQLRLPTASDLTGLYDEAAGDPEVLSLAGCLSGVDEVLADPALAADLLGLLGDPDRRADPVLLRDVYARLADALGTDPPDFPDAVRVAPDRVAGREACVVLDAPYLLPLLSGLRVVPAGGRPGPVADLLGVPFASDRVAGHVDSSPVRVATWSTVPGVSLAVERCGAVVPPAEVAWHEELRVDGRPVGWWPSGGVDHVDTGAGSAGLGRALAWRLDRWALRAAVAEALAEPEASGALRAEDGAG